MWENPTHQSSTCEWKFVTSARGNYTIETDETPKSKSSIGKVNLLVLNKHLLEQSSVLSEEIRRVGCQIASLRKGQVVTQANTNGFLSARLLGLWKCTRVKGEGMSIVLQSCSTTTVTVTDIQTRYGFHPLVTTKKAT